MSKKTISNDQKKQFRTLAHNLNPIVTVAGNGLSEGVVDEIKRAIDDHELIKIKLAITDREIRGEVIDEICTLTRAIVIQKIGKVVVVFKASNKETLKTSNVR